MWVGGAETDLGLSAAVAPGISETKSVTAKMATFLLPPATAGSQVERTERNEWINRKDNVLELISVAESILFGDV